MKFDGAGTLGALTQRTKNLGLSTNLGKATKMFENTGISLPTFKPTAKAPLPETATTDFGEKLLDTDRDIPNT